MITSENYVELIMPTSKMRREALHFLSVASLAMPELDKCNRQYVAREIARALDLFWWAETDEKNMDRHIFTAYKFAQNAYKATEAALSR